MICEKATYHSKKLAEEAINGFQYSLRTKKRPVKAYKCNTCGGWHTTSNKIKQHIPRSITKELHTSQKKSHRPLFIMDLTRARFNNTMARISVLLLSGGILLCVASGYDSRVDNVTTPLVYAYDDYGYDIILPSYAHEADVPADFVIYHPELGSQQPVNIHAEAQPSKGYLPAIRGPPDSCYKKS